MTLDGKKSVVFLLVLALFAIAPLFSREVVISLEDMDLGIPLEGARIRSWDGNDHFCDDDGKVVIQVPEDRQVTIRASYPGYESGALVVPLNGDSFTLGLRLAGVIEGRELVIEAQRPGLSETRSGRSVAISGEAMERSSQIGVVEDVMTSIKLLPGVGYTGMFSALPSIRGGDPGDLMAVYDGFYIENPYHWGGGFSIFDPQMTASAQLSHGIFSTRYGHTISGLLEVASKKADPTAATLDLGISTSAVNLNLSYPFGNKGGIVAMGKLTYWDPFIWAMKKLTTVVDNETLDLINAVTTAPYIRSSAINFNYRFNQDLELSSAFFVGVDGVGAAYSNSTRQPWIDYSSHMKFDWDNLQTFLITGLTYNPRPSMVLRTTLGAGAAQAKIDAEVEYYKLAIYNENEDGTRAGLKYEIPPGYLDTWAQTKQTVFNLQAKTDFDWSLGNGFLAAAGVQELYSQTQADQEGKFLIERWIYQEAGVPGFYIQRPVYTAVNELNNRRFNSSAYILGEYTSPDKKYGAELGLRLDHLYFIGKDFNIQTMPVLNPRLNLDYNVFRDAGFVQSLDLTAGTGFFSSMNDAISAITVDSGIDDFTLKPNRSWTSVAGVKMDFTQGWSLNVEGYYKYVFDRAYRYTFYEPGQNSRTVYRFDGDGIVWGFDAILQKFDSRYWDGWLSYTFNHAKYHLPARPKPGLDSTGATVLEDSGWYYPYFHRFHNLNLVLNIKPVRNFNIYTRFGLASGRPKAAVGSIDPYSTHLQDENGNPILDSEGNPMVITKYKRQSAYDDNSRTTWSIPLDLKLSYYITNNRNKVRTEIYLAAENLLSLVYVAKSNTTFNTYTGREDTGSDSANYEMPIPMVSFGIKWSY